MKVADQFGVGEAVAWGLQHVDPNAKVRKLIDPLVVSASQGEDGDVSIFMLAAEHVNTELLETLQQEQEGA